MKKVMITGIGMLTAVGNGREASWTNIKAGKPGIGKITKEANADVNADSNINSTDSLLILKRALGILKDSDFPYKK